MYLYEYLQKITRILRQVKSFNNNFEHFITLMPGKGTLWTPQYVGDEVNETLKILNPKVYTF